jgi:hypothetical protein
MAERSAWVNELARATPPNFPRATALGFFFVAMPCIISLNGKPVKEKLLKFRAFPTTQSISGFSIRGTAPVSGGRSAKTASGVEAIFVPAFVIRLGAGM